jgi:thymidylate synthase
MINAANVRDALPKAVRHTLHSGNKEKTRNGDAWVCTTPVSIRYEYPKQHVLVNEVRDANPFFHLMEAMWMLAGREDGAFLDNYIKDFSKLYGSFGIVLDAYGYRWRYGLMSDQLLEIVRQLKETPNTRQAVLQMWGAGRKDLFVDTVKPCNLVATFRIQPNTKVLDMTVFNRSNDLVWGCCGANAVHFPIMQEYIASMVGVEMGRYWQISTNLHFYQEHLDMLSKRVHQTPRNNLFVALKSPDEYEQTQPLIEYPELFDKELRDTMQWIEELHEGKEVYNGDISNSFLGQVVLPMAEAHYLYKKKDFSGALDKMEEVIAEDWRRAGIGWIARRNHDRPQ